MDARTSLKWLRWAFNAREWKPKPMEWVLANQSIQPEERVRIDRFVHQDSAKSAMIGRLMLRQAIHLATGLSHSNIQLQRTTEGRPYMDGLSPLDVNVSHHGDWVVLALESEGAVGIDIMSLTRPVNIDLDKYFSLMRRQFTPGEWGQMESAENKLSEFYRFWCLKESYVKADGMGLNINLQTINFITKDSPSVNSLCTSTTLELHGTPSSDWLFEETLLDSNHCIAVCRSKQTAEICDQDRLYSQIAIETLLPTQAILSEQNMIWWSNFNKKPQSANLTSS